MSKKTEGFELFDQVDDPRRCQSKGVVLNTYNNMCSSGCGEREALKAATKVLCHHQPCASCQARNIVECWVFQNSSKASN